jgi:hypothetical protein
MNVNRQEIEATVARYCELLRTYGDRTPVTTGPMQRCANGMHAYATTATQWGIRRGAVKAEPVRVLDVSIDGQDRVTCQVQWHASYETGTRQRPAVRVQPRRFATEAAKSAPKPRPDATIDAVELSRVAGQWSVSDSRLNGQWQSERTCVHSEVICGAPDVTIECLSTVLLAATGPVPDAESEEVTTLYLWRFVNQRRKATWLMVRKDVYVLVKSGQQWVIDARLRTRQGLIASPLVMKQVGFLGTRPPELWQYDTVVPLGHAGYGERGRW